MQGLIVGLSCYLGHPCQLVVQVCDPHIARPAPAVRQVHPRAMLGLSVGCEWMSAPPPAEH